MTKYAMILVLAFFFTLQIKAEELTINERLTNSVVFSFLGDQKSEYTAIIRMEKEDIKKQNGKISDIIKNKLDISKEFKFNYIGIPKANIKIEGLDAETAYFIDLYKKSKNGLDFITSSIKFYTLATEPTQPSDNLAFFHKKHDGMDFVFKRGNGQNRIVIMKKNAFPTVPKDGMPIDSALGGNKWQNIGNDSYIVWSSTGHKKQDKNDGVILPAVSGLESGSKYYFYVVEYNGSGQTTNVLHKNGASNPRYAFTTALPPTLNDPTEIGKDKFKISWSKIDNGIAYVIDVATDEKFENKIDYFNNFDVDNLTEIEVDCGKSGNKIFWVRVKAYTEGGETTYSEPMKVVLR